MHGHGPERKQTVCYNRPEHEPQATLSTPTINKHAHIQHSDTCAHSDEHTSPYSTFIGESTTWWIGLLVAHIPSSAPHSHWLYKRCQVHSLRETVSIRRWSDQWKDTDIGSLITLLKLTSYREVLSHCRQGQLKTTKHRLIAIHK